MDWRLIGDGAKFSLTAQLMVFLVLTLLALLLVLMKALLYRPNRRAGGEVNAAGAAAESAADGSASFAVESADARKVAAIAAALTQHEESRVPPVMPAGQQRPWSAQRANRASAGIKTRRWGNG